MKLHKPRVMLFAYDGTGLGHLMRLIRIAECLKDSFNPLVVTGHRAVCQMIPDGIEFIRIPVFSSIASEQAGMKGHSLNVKEFRSDTLLHIGKLFKPHILITDYMPAGKKNELLKLIVSSPCLKYLIMRGDIGSLDQLQNIVFNADNNTLIENFYDRVFIASDARIDDFSSDTSIPRAVRDKFQHVGYVTKKVSKDEIYKIRKDRNLDETRPWVVCSAGGGRMGEDLIRKCIQMGQEKNFAMVQFDIIRGYYSDIPWPNDLYDTIMLSHNIRFSRSVDALPIMHAAADCVVCSGGYNSLLETMQGRNKHVLAYSVQINENEQLRNIMNFQRFYPIHHVSNLETLPFKLKQCLNVPAPLPTMDIDTDGARQIVNWIKKDFENANSL